jgi:heat shock protein HspQ
MYIDTISVTSTQFAIGQVVKHRIYDFRGVIVDVDPEFNNTEEWWLAIPEDVRPRKDQPFYHLLAENETTAYEAYVSEQNLLIDETGEFSAIVTSCPTVTVTNFATPVILANSPIGAMLIPGPRF